MTCPRGSVGAGTHTGTQDGIPRLDVPRSTLGRPAGTALRSGDRDARSHGTRRPASTRDWPRLQAVVGNEVKAQGQRRRVRPHDQPDGALRSAAARSRAMGRTRSDRQHGGGMDPRRTVAGRHRGRGSTSPSTSKRESARRRSARSAQVGPGQPLTVNAVVDGGGRCTRPSSPASRPR